MGEKPQRRIRPGRVDLADDEPVLLVNYTLEEDVVDDTGDVISSGSAEHQKRIPVKINESTDCDEKARKLTEKHKHISTNQTARVEMLLRQLQQRQQKAQTQSVPSLDMTALSDPSSKQHARPVTARTLHSTSSYQTAPASHIASLSDDGPAPVMAKLPEYIEQLYEDDLDTKLETAAAIAQLGRDLRNLPEILEEKTLVRSLARTLREDHRKSISLTFNVALIFFIVSNFSDQHQILLDNQVGDAVMKVVEWEDGRSKFLERYFSWLLKSLRLVTEVTNRDRSMAVDERKKLEKMQQRVLYICTSLLLNMAEDPKVEWKLKKRNIIHYLSEMLFRDNSTLLCVALEFLKKLSIHMENVEQMVYQNVAEGLTRVLSLKSENVMYLATRLALNLSFDSSLREAMIRAGIIKHLVNAMRRPQIERVAAAVLFNLGREERSADYLLACDGTSLVRERLAKLDSFSSYPELAGLALRLAQAPETAGAISNGDLFNKLMKQALEHKDPIGFKLLRALSENSSESMERFGPYMKQMLQCLKDPQANGQLEEEVFATLSSLLLTHSLQAELWQLVRENSLLPFALSRLRSGAAVDTRLLEAVIFLGATANEQLAGDLARSNTPQRVAGMVAPHLGDADINRAAAWSLGRMALLEDTRILLLYEEDAIYSLLSLLGAKHEVSVEASKALDVIADYDYDWADMIKEAKFEQFNGTWLQMQYGSASLKQAVPMRT